MSDERRYDEDEVRRIFDAATEAELSPERRVPTDGGLTLSELEEIGSEAGIPRQLVVRAARRLDRGGSAPEGRGVAPAGASVDRIVGLPIGVERAVDLPRNLDDGEWGRLVLEARNAFGARGQLHEVGPVREWRDGALYVALEPTEAGARLSMGTRQEQVRPLAAVSTTFLTAATVLFVVMVLTGEIAEAGAVVVPLFMAVLGLAIPGVAALRLPSWAKRRSHQMEELAATALALAEESSAES